jgi:hypothetical protein
MPHKGKDNTVEDRIRLLHIFSQNLSSQSERSTLGGDEPLPNHAN